MKALIAFAAMSLVAASTAQGAEIKVLSGNGAKAAVRELCAQFERETGNKINLHFEVNADLKKKIEAGESFDVAVLNPPVIDALSREGKLVTGSRADIGRFWPWRCGAQRRPEARHLICRCIQAHPAGR